MNGHVTGQDSINSIAKEVGIDTGAMEAKMKTPEIDKVLTANRELATSVGLHGTPAFIVNGELVPGAVDYETLKQLVAKAREKK